MDDCPFAAAKKALRYLARRVQLEKEIAELLEDLDQITQQACPGLRKTYGIAFDCTLMLPTETLCGVIPLPTSSGKTNRH